MKDMTQSL